MSLAHRLIRNQGATLTACARLVKSCTKSRRTSDAECGSACEPQRASPEAHIYRVALLAKDLGHLLRSASCSCTLQDSQRYDIINQRFPRKKPPPFRIERAGNVGRGVAFQPNNQVCCRVPIRSDSWCNCSSHSFSASHRHRSVHHPGRPV